MDATSLLEPESQAAVPSSSAVEVASDASIAPPSSGVQDLIRAYESPSAAFTIRPAPSPSTPRRQDWTWRHVRHSTYENAATPAAGQSD